jgi:integrase
MAASIQPRANKFQLRVTHKLLPKPFFFTFDKREEAEGYRDQLVALLARGVVPQEMLVKPAHEDDPMLTVVIEQYQRQTSVTDSDSELFKTIKLEVIGVRVSGVTFKWSESYVRSLKAPDKHLAPSTIRKRVGALGRVVDWHIKQTTKEGDLPRANPLRMLSRGYSVYNKEDAKLVDAPKEDVVRNRRLAPEECKRVDAVLAGVKRDDRERVFTDDQAFALMYQLIVDTGMRLFEAYRLRVDAVDQVKHIIQVDGSKGHRGLIKPRVVPIKKELRTRLYAWCRGRVGLVFPYWDGTPEQRKKTQQRLTQRFLGLFDYARVPDFSEHDLRHEAACRWFELRNERGWVFSEIEVCRIMGWSDTRMALRYASLRGEDLSSRLG